MNAILLLNIQGMLPNATSVQRWKHEYLSTLIEDSSRFYPIIALTETWIKPGVHSDAQISIENYTVHRADRISRDRGGTLIYTHNSIPITSSISFDDDTCEAVFLTSLPNKLIIACIYRPGKASSASFNKLISFLERCIDKITDSDNYTKVVMGDFNFPEIWNNQSEDAQAKSESEKALIKFMNKYFLCQYVDVSTRQQNILDLLLTNNDRLVHHVTSEKHEKLSDHKVVEIMIPSTEISVLNKKQTSFNKPQLQGFNALDFHKANFENISTSLDEIDWDTLWANSTIEEFPKLLQSTVLQICKKHSPAKCSLTKNGSAHKRAYRSKLRKKRKLKVRLDCLRSVNPSSPKILTLEQNLKSLLEELKNLTFSNQYEKEKKAVERIKSKPKYFYSYAKKFAKTKQSIAQLIIDENEVLTKRKDIADSLQDQFCSVFSNPNNPAKEVPSTQTPNASLSDISFRVEDIIEAIDKVDENASCPDFSIPAIVLKTCKHSLSKPLFIMWQDSLNCGIVPAHYKQQLVTPVHKNGSRSLPPNYRPVSLTAHEIKIFERVIHKRMVKFMDENLLLSCRQHGFRKGRSCLTQLLKQYDEILTNLLALNETDVIYLDFAKAFDKVDHEILLKKLTNIGITGKLLDWLESFLSDRNQTVVVDGVLSYLTSVLSGVPQGTVLGPLLFLIYVNDISNCIQFSKISCFADDARILKSISTSSDSSLLQQDLYAVSRWSKANNMELNDDKFVYLNFNSRPNNFLLANLPFYKENLYYTTPSGKVLESSSDVSDLGVTFSDNFDWSLHVSSIVQKAKKKAGWALSVFSNRSPQVMVTLYKSMIRSLLEYACPVWCGLSLQNLRDLESIQRSFTNKVICPAYVSDYWERLQYLKLRSLQRRRERYIILHLWKILNNQVSNDLNIQFYESLRYGPQAHVPSLISRSSLKAQTLYDSSLAVAGTKLWNMIPKSVKLCSSLNSFKANLDLFLNGFPDRPPVSGYVVQNNNSLLEWNIARSR